VKEFQASDNAFAFPKLVECRTSIGGEHVLAKDARLCDVHGNEALGDAAQFPVMRSIFVFPQM